MKNINTTKYKVNFGLKMLTILAFVLIFVPFNRASAAYGINVAFCGTDDCSNPATVQNQPIQTQVAYNSTPIIHSKTTVKHTTTGTAKITASANLSNNATNGDNTNSSANSYNGLAANAIYGSNSFLPTGLLQWILLAIFILILVILSRKVFGREDSYHSTPLKHA